MKLIKDTGISEGKIEEIKKEYKKYSVNPPHNKRKRKKKR
jgi:hypothetical protein